MEKYDIKSQLLLNENEIIIQGVAEKKSLNNFNNNNNNTNTI